MLCKLFTYLNVDVDFYVFVDVDVVMDTNDTLGEVGLNKNLDSILPCT